MASYGSQQLPLKACNYRLLLEKKETKKREKKTEVHIAPYGP